MSSMLTKHSSSIDINTSEFKRILKDNPGIVIDVRTRDEYEEGHLKIADSQYDLAKGEFKNQLSKLDKNETYYLYCRSGSRSGRAARMMKNNGFEKVYNIGGYSVLKSAGFEIE